MGFTSLVLYVKRAYYLFLMLIYWMKYKFTFYAYTPEKPKKALQKL